VPKFWHGYRVTNFMNIRWKASGMEYTPTGQSEEQITVRHHVHNGQTQQTPLCCLTTSYSTTSQGPETRRRPRLRRLGSDNMSLRHGRRISQEGWGGWMNVQQWDNHDNQSKWKNCRENLIIRFQESIQRFSDPETWLGPWNYITWRSLAIGWNSWIYIATG
jgi:hypothetical protein